jgi:homoserine dehydrogenase
MSAPLRIAVAGLGTVGAGVVEILQRQTTLLSARCNRDIMITAVSARDASRDRGVSLANIAWEENTVALASRKDVDVVVELIGGSEGVAKSLCETALAQGKHVVTANKALIAHHGGALAKLAEQRGIQLMFEAAVAGGIPVIKLMKQGLAANNYTKIVGILNGTCNFILSTMERTRRSFEDVLSEAQALGYAEADPSFDIDGVDAAHKLCILSALAFSTTPAIDGITIEGIRNISAADILAAEELGYRIRLIGITERTDRGIELRVYPALLPEGSPVSEVDGVYNAVHIFGDAVGDMFIEGRGAGRGATASAVIADIMEIARGDVSQPFLVPAASLATPVIVPMEDYESAYYVRLHVADHSGVLFALTRIFSAHDISVASFIQHAPKEATHGVDIILTTHTTLEKRMNHALREISAMPSILSSPCLIRIEE